MKKITYDKSTTPLIVVLRDAFVASFNTNETVIGESAIIYFAPPEMVGNKVLTSIPWAAKESLSKPLSNVMYYFLEQTLKLRKDLLKITGMSSDCYVVPSLLDIEAATVIRLSFVDDDKDATIIGSWFAEATVSIDNITAELINQFLTDFIKDRVSEKNSTRKSNEVDKAGPPANSTNRNDQKIRKLSTEVFEFIGQNIPVYDGYIIPDEITNDTDAQMHRLNVAKLASRDANLNHAETTYLLIVSKMLKLYDNGQPAKRY